MLSLSYSKRSANSNYKEMVWQVLKKLNAEFPHDPATPLLSTYPEELKTGIQTDIYTPVFIEASLAIAKRWRQPKCLSANEG